MRARSNPKPHPTIRKEIPGIRAGATIQVVRFQALPRFSGHFRLLEYAGIKLSIKRAGEFRVTIRRITTTNSIPSMDGYENIYVLGAISARKFEPIIGSAFDA